MHDIKIPDMHGKKDEFEVKHVSESEAKRAEPGEKVKVKFKNFVHLVAAHDFESILQKYSQEDLILSTNLLTDLASAHEEVQTPRTKTPIFFIVGIIVGIVITYLIIHS